MAIDVSKFQWGPGNQYAFDPITKTYYSGVVDNGPRPIGTDSAGNVMYAPESNNDRITSPWGTAGSLSVGGTHWRVSPDQKYGAGDFDLTNASPEIKKLFQASNTTIVGSAKPPTAVDLKDSGNPSLWGSMKEAWNGGMKYPVGGFFGALAGGAAGIGSGAESGGTLFPGEAVIGTAGNAYGGAASAGFGGMTGAEIWSGIKSLSSVISPATSLLQVAAGMKAAKGTPGGGPSGGPAIEAPVTMPTLGDASSMNALRANLQQQVVRRGRAATILTAPDSGTKLGA